MRRYTRFARMVAVVAGLAAILMSSATVALAKPAHRQHATKPKPTTATAPLRPPSFCGYWGPLYSYVFPDGTVLRCS
jgi:hypothetical protein